MGLVLLTGLACGLIGAGYLFVLHVLQNFLWPTEWSGAIGFAILGGVGVVVALVVRFVGTSGDVELMVDNIHVSGSATGVRMLRSLIPTSWLCIASGGGMGPEAPLVQTTGTLASWTARRAGLVVRESRILTIAGMAAGFTVLFGAPLGSAIFALEMLHRRGLQYYEALLPAVLGSLAGYSVYVVATEADLAPVWHLPSPASIHPRPVVGGGGRCRRGARRHRVHVPDHRPPVGGAATAPRAATDPRRVVARRARDGVGVLPHVRRGADQRDPHQARGNGRVLRAGRLRQARGNVGHPLLRVARRLHHPPVLHGRLSRPHVPRHRAGHERGGDGRHVHGRLQHRGDQDAARIDARGERDGRIPAPADDPARVRRGVRAHQRGRVDPHATGTRRRRRGQRRTPTAIQLQFYSYCYRADS